MKDFLDLSQLDTNTFKLNKEFFSIFESIDQAFYMLSHMAKQKKIILVAPQVNDCDQVTFDHIYGDRNRMA